MDMPHVRDFMELAGRTVTPDSALYDALDVLVKKHASGVVVTDDTGVVIGVLTEKDCIRIMTNAHMHNQTGARVADYMSTVKESLTEEMDLLSASTKFLETNFATLPVLSEDGRLVGTVTRQGILQAIRKMFASLGRARGAEKESQAVLDNPRGIENLQKLAASGTGEMATVLRGRHTDEN